MNKAKTAILGIRLLYIALGLVFLFLLVNAALHAENLPQPTSSTTIDLNY